MRVYVVHLVYYDYYEFTDFCGVFADLDKALRHCENISDKPVIYNNVDLLAGETTLPDNNNEIVYYLITECEVI